MVAIASLAPVISVPAAAAAAIAAAATAAAPVAAAATAAVAPFSAAIAALVVVAPVAVAAATAAAAVAASGAAPGAAGSAAACLVHANGPSVQARSVHSLQRVLGLVGVIELDEAESTRPAGVFVADHVGLGDVSILGEGRHQGFLIGVEAEASDEKFTFVVHL